MPRRPGHGNFEWLFGVVFALGWMAFLVFPTVDAISTGSRVQAAASLLAVGTFVLVYSWFWLRVRSTHEAEGAPVAFWSLLLLSTALVLGSGDRWGYTFIYVAVLAGAGFAPRAAAVAVAGVAGLVALLALVLLDGAGLALGGAFLVGMLGAMTLVVGRLMHANQSLSEARGEIARLAAADERARISRDLHDLLGHTLSLIVLKAELAGRVGPSDPGRAVVEAQEIERVARDALHEVREAVAGYRRLTLDVELMGARAALRAAGIQGRIADPGAILPADVDGVLAWVVREAVTNVVRHSHARSCEIRLSMDTRRAELEVLDDGGGAVGDRRGSGLRGLEERVGERGGSLRAEARRGGGFRLAVSLPLAAAET